jgi:SAM-dependent methyltransferase
VHQRGGALGHALQLPFAASAFGAVRADRVLQHLADPLAALGEMIRVTRSNGRVIVADPDQESLAIHVPGVPADLVARVKETRRDVGYRNGRLASALPDAFAGAGLHDVTVRAFPLVLTDPDDAFGLPTWVAYWRDRGHGFDDADAASGTRHRTSPGGRLRLRCSTSSSPAPSP